MTRHLIAFVLLTLIVPFVAPREVSAQVPQVGVPSIATCPALSRSLSFGMRGQDVVQLQNFLIARGYLAPGNNTGNFYSLTQAAVQSFQKAQGISPIGIVGPQTRAAIARVCGSGGGSTGSSGASTITMSATPVNGPAPLIVAYVITAAGDGCGSYILDYGDGSIESIASICGTRTVPHTYPSSGSYASHLDQNAFINGQVTRVQKAGGTITVGPAAVAAVPTCIMSSTKTSIHPNDPVTLTWSSTNATSAKWADNTSSGTSGSAVFSDISTTTTKTITFTGSGGSKACSITVTVTPAPTGTIVASGNAIANGSVVVLPAGGQSAFKLADFTLTAGSVEAVTLKSFVFTLRNQTGNSSPGAATVSNYRTTIGTNSYVVSVTKNGVYDNATVSLGSGITIAAGQSLGVAIFADVVPNSGGNLDLWIYPADMIFAGVTTGAAIKATSNVTNRVDTNLLYWSGWISVALGGGGGGASGACYMNGQGYPVDPRLARCGNPRGPIDKALCVVTDGAMPQCTQECRDLASQPACGSDGWLNVSWAMGYLNPPYVTVGCTSSNGLYVPGNMRVAGNRCTENNTTQTNCEVKYICKRDGWWQLDGAGFEIRKLNSSPWIYPEQFYPDGGQSPVP